MGILQNAPPAPVFVDVPSSTDDGTHSTAVVNTLIDIAETIDEASRLGGDASCDLYGEPHENTAVNPVRRWVGGFVFIAGMTTLTMVVRRTSASGGDVWRIRTRKDTTDWGSITPSSYALSTGDNTISHTLSGYVEGDMVEVFCQMYNAGQPADNYDWPGNVWVTMAYVSPVAITGAYPTIPTYTASNMTAPNLNLLGDAATWLLRTMGRRYLPLWQAPVKRQGPFNDATTTLSQTTVRWWGGLTRTSIHTTLNVSVQVDVLVSGRTEAVRLYINDVVVVTQNVTGTKGVYTPTLTTSLSGYSVGAHLRLSVDLQKTAPVGDRGNTSRFSVWRIWTDAPAGTPVNIAKLSVGTLTPNALRDKLNEIRTTLNAAQTRLAAHPELWARQQLFCYTYSFDDFQAAFFRKNQSIALMGRRLGEALYLRGRGVTLGYSTGAFEQTESKEDGGYDFENDRSAQVVNSDAIENTLFYLDSPDGLTFGDPYNLRGEVIVAFERLKVTP
jgi:hypothetical protein